VKEGVGINQTIELMFIMLDTVASIITCEKNEDLGIAKLHTTKIAHAQVLGYLQRELNYAVVRAVFRMRLDFIINAKSLSELDAIVSTKASLPRYDFGTWRTGPYHIPEEELLFWGVASLGVKLYSHATDRALEIFERISKDLGDRSEGSL